MKDSRQTPIVEISALEVVRQRQRVLAAASEGPAMPARDLAEVAGVGTSVVRGLAEQGALERSFQEI